MTTEIVDVFVSDDTVNEDPVSSVLIRVYQSDGITFVQQATTDVNGQISILLTAPATYQLRLFKNQVSFTQPQQISVLETPVAPDTNQFDVVAHIFSPPESIDARLCRCSGFFRNPDGSKAINTDLVIHPKFRPLLLEGAAVVTEPVKLTTDKDGYAQIDLIRFGQYDVQLEGIEDWLVCISVPDQPSAALPDLLFTVVASVQLDPAGPYTLTVGQELVITPTVIWSDGNVEQNSEVEHLRWSTEDENIAVVLPTSTSFTLRGIGAGVTNLVAERIDTSIVRIPDAPIGGLPLSITVS